jgi:HEAT repeat protein
VREEALYHLGRSVVHVDQVIVSIANALEDADVNVCRQAALSLFIFGAASRIAVRQLIRVLEHPDAIVRSASAATLCLIGPEATEALPALRRIENDPNQQVQAWAREALVSIQGKAPQRP